MENRFQSLWECNKNIEHDGPTIERHLKNLRDWKGKECDYTGYETWVWKEEQDEESENSIVLESSF